MPTYTITDPSTGRRLRVTGESPPTERELVELFRATPEKRAGGPILSASAGSVTASPASIPETSRSIKPAGSGGFYAPWYDDLVGGVTRAGGAAAGFASDVLGLARAPLDWAARRSAGALGLDVDTWAGPDGLPAPPTSAEMGVEALLPDRRQGMRAIPDDFRRAAAESPLDMGIMAGLSALGLSPGVLGAPGTADRLLRDLPGLATVQAGVERAARPVLEVGAGLLTDPLSVAGAQSVGRALLTRGAAGRAGPVLAGIDEALAKGGAGLAAAGAVGSVADAGREALRGDLGEAALSLEEAALQGAFAALGARGAREIAARRRARKLDTGPIYRGDPNATPEQLLELDAHEAKLAERADALAGRDIVALDRALDRAKADPLPAPPRPETELRGASFEPEPVAPQPKRSRATIETAFLDRLDANRLTSLRDELALRLEEGTINEAEAQALLHVNARLAERGRLLTENAAMRAADTQAPPQEPPLPPVDANGRPQRRVEVELTEADSKALAKALRLAPVGAPRLRSPERADMRARLVPDPEFAGGLAEGTTSGGPGRVAYDAPQSTVRASPAAQAAAPDANLGDIPAGRTPEGYRALARAKGRSPERLWSGGPRVAREAQARLLRLWKEERAALPERGSGGQVDPDVARGTLRDRQLLRTVEPAYDALARLPKSGREMEGRARGYVGEWEVRDGQGTGDFSERVKPLQGDAVAFERVARALDGQVQGPDGAWQLAPPEARRQAIDALQPAEREAALALRERFDADRRVALEAGVITPDQAARFDAEGYWPNRMTPEAMATTTPEAQALRKAAEKGITFEEALAEIREPGSKLVAGTRAGRKAVFEHRRSTGEAALGLDAKRYDAGVLAEYNHEFARRVSEARHLGKDGELVQGLIGSQPELADQRFAQTFFDRIRDVEPQGALHRFSANARAAQSFSGLILSPVTQATTLANTAAETSVRALGDGLRRTFLREVKTPDGEPISWGKPIRRLRASIEEARLDARRTGAVFASTAQGLADFATKAALDPSKAGDFNAWVSRRSWIKATGYVDEMQRVIAANTADFAIREAQARAAKGDKAAARQLERWQVKPGAEVTPELVQSVAKLISDRAQFKVGIGELPLWASSPIGKMAFQFQSFGYKHAQMLWWAGKEAMAGNVRPMLTLALGGAALGYASNTLKQALRVKGFDEPSEEGLRTVITDAYATFSGRKHVAPTSPEGAVLAAIEGLGAAGGFGILQTAMERSADSRSTVTDIAGPVGGDVESLARALAPLVLAGDESKSQRGAEAVGDETGAAAAARRAREKRDQFSRGLARFGAGLLPQTPIASPNEALREFASADLPPSNPGGLGRLRDALSEQPVDRESIRRLERFRDAAKRAEARRAGITSEKPPEPVAKRAEDAEKDARRSQARLEIAEAIRNGADDAAIEALLATWLTRGVNLYPSRKMIFSDPLKTVRERTIRRPR